MSSQDVHVYIQRVWVVCDAVDAFAAEPNWQGLQAAKIRVIICGRCSAQHKMFIVTFYTRHTVNQQNYAGNIISILAGLPEYLRKPMLKSRLNEFQHLSQDEQDDTIRNALEAGPQIPFDVFAKLFKTWLVVLAEMPDAQRSRMLECYATRMAEHPEEMVPLHTDGLLGVFLEVDPHTQQTLAASIRDVIKNMTPSNQKRLLVMMPDSAKAALEL